MKLLHGYKSGSIVVCSAEYSTYDIRIKYLKRLDDEKQHQDLSDGELIEYGDRFDELVQLSLFLEDLIQNTKYIQGKVQKYEDAMKEKTTIDLTPIKYLKEHQKYVMNIQSEKGKAGIYCEIINIKEDSSAIGVFTTKRDKTKVFLGYVKKNEYVFTSRAENLYDEYKWELYKNGNDYDSNEIHKIKSKNGWAEKKQRPLYNSLELENIIKYINEDKYNFRYEFNDESSYLFSKRLSLN